MSTDAMMGVLAELTFAASASILVVALMRKPLRRFAGARVTYWLWLLMPASQLVVSLPAPSRPSELASHTFPEWIVTSVPAVSSGSSAGAFADYAGIVLIAWIAGGLLMLAFTIRLQRAFVRSLGPTSEAADGTHRSFAVRGPVLVGVWRPRIVLPADFESRYSPEERALVLAHERAHRRRGDPLVNAIGTAWLCLSWFNPLMYWAMARFRFDQELACDAVVLAGSSARRRRYADALLKAQLATESAWPVLAGCHWQSSHPLKERIVMLSRPLPTVTRRLSGAVLTLTLIVAGSVALWTAQPEQSHAQPELQRGNAPLELRDPTLTIHSVTVTADRASRLPNGDIEFSGAVVIAQTSDASRITGGGTSVIAASTVTYAQDGAAVLEGPIRISFEDGGAFTTDRMTIEDGTIRMDSARFSPPAETSP